VVFRPGEVPPAAVAAGRVTSAGTRCLRSRRDRRPLTVALTAKEPGTPEPKVLRQALFTWAFHPVARDTDPPPEIAPALEWADRASRPVSALEDAAAVRAALGVRDAVLTGG